MQSYQSILEKYHNYHLGKNLTSALTFIGCDTIMQKWLEIKILQKTLDFSDNMPQMLIS